MERCYLVLVKASHCLELGANRTLEFARVIVVCARILKDKQGAIVRCLRSRWRKKSLHGKVCKRPSGDKGKVELLVRMKKQVWIQLVRVVTDHVLCPTDACHSVQHMIIRQKQGE